MKFLHIGNNICGIPNAIARAQREAGHEATTLSFEPDPQGHQSDILIPTTSRVNRFLALLERDDEVFFFVGDTPVGGIDILFWKLLGKKVAIEYHGSEVRGKGPRLFHRFADALFVSTPDLLDDVPGGVWLPSPIFIGDYPVAEPNGTVIAHAPSNREAKGTQYLVEAFERVLKKIPTAKLNLIEGVPYPEAIQQYRHATVMVDQLKIGWYGMVTLECMAMGVPVMCYIRGDLREYLHCAVCYTSPERLEKDLLLVLSCEGYLDFWAKKGKSHVSTVHNPKECVKKIMGALK